MYYKKPVGKHRGKSHKRFTNDKEKKKSKQTTIKEIISYKEK